MAKIEVCVCVCVSPQKQEYETHCLSVIQSSQWDLVDALNFLNAPSLYWPHEVGGRD